MGIADEFERRLERAVEGVFSKAFRSEVEPAEILRRLMREMETGKSVSVNTVYVPNSFEIRLSEADHSKLQGLFPALTEEFTGLLEAHAKTRRWKPAGAVKIAYEESADLKEGRFEVRASHDAQSAEPARQVSDGGATLEWVGFDRSTPLRSNEITLGRSSQADVEVSDQMASRNHARIFKREEAWWITDLDSLNGTAVNGTVVGERRLSDGDVIKIGDTEFKFVEGEGV